MSLCPASAAGWNNLAAAQFHLQEYQEALSSWEEALKLEPGSLVFLKNKILVLQKLNRFKEALTFLEEKKLQGVEWNLLKADIYNGLNNPEDEVKELKTVLELQPENQNCRYRMANLLKKTGKVSEAKEEYKKLIVSGKNQMPEAYYHLALLEYQEKNAAKSLDYMDKWLALHPTDVTGLQLQAYLHEIVWQKQAREDYQKGHFPECLSGYDKLIKEFPDKPFYYYNRGLCLLKLKKEEEALKDFSFVLEFNPRHKLALYQRGNLYFIEQKWKDAVSDFLTLSVLEPSAELWLKIAISEYNSGEDKLSQEHYRKARDKDPSLPEYETYFSQEKP